VVTDRLPGPPLGLDLKSGPGPGDDAQEIQRLMKDVSNLRWQELPKFK